MKIQNNHNKVAVLVALLGIICAPYAILAQSATNEDIPRLSNGRPDLQGTWDFRTITPFERPSGLAGKELLTAEEQEAFRLEELERTDSDNFTDTTTSGDYNEFWYYRGQEILDDGRTSLITDPPTGRIPALT